MIFKSYIFFNFLITLLIGFSIASCTHNQSASDIISEGFHLANEGKYDEAQLKCLQAEEFNDSILASGILPCRAYSMCRS